MPLDLRPKPMPVAPAPPAESPVTQILLKKEVAPMADNLVSVPADVLASLQSTAVQAQATIAAHEAEARAADARAMIARGETNAVLQRHQAEIAESKARTAKLAVATELSRALATKPLGPHAAEQLETILSGELIADETPTGFNVRTRDFQDVNTYVSNKLAQPSYAHFLASHQNAAPAATPGAPATGSPAEPPREPRTAGEAIMMRAQQERQKAVAENRSWTTDPSISGFRRGGHSPLGALANHLSGINWKS